MKSKKKRMSEWQFEVTIKCQNKIVQRYPAVCMISISDCEERKCRKPKGEIRRLNLEMVYFKDRKVN